MCTHCMRFAAVAVMLNLICPAIHAQTIFKGILFNDLDSSAIGYAAVGLRETGAGITTDDKGEFQFALPQNIKTVTLGISAIGVKTTVVFKYPFKNVERIYLHIAANALGGVEVKGLSAEEVVKIAVASIPDNYADSSYFDYSFYRRYQKVNGRYVNLFEAYPAVMFRLSKGKRRITSKEAFAVSKLRRTKFYSDISNVIEDNPVDLLVENPVYHIESGLLDPVRFTGYAFSFDTTKKSDDYLVRYVCNVSSTDKHGVPSYENRDLGGEAWDAGEITIDRTSFAIKRIHRKSRRHSGYHYKFFPPQNNIVTFSNRNYLFEFIDGDLDVTYAQRRGKWYLDRICRQYTDEFYLPVFETKEFTITDNFEWYSDSISRYTTDEYVNKFYPKMATAIHEYDTAAWLVNRFPFFFAPKADVYKDLERDGPLDKQFYDETKVDEYIKPKDRK